MSLYLAMFIVRIEHFLTHHDRSTFVLLLQLQHALEFFLHSTVSFFATKQCIIRLLTHFITTSKYYTNAFHQTKE